MNFKNLKINDLYRGSIPFFLCNIKNNLIFLASSNKNIEDYYNTLIENTKYDVLKIDYFENEDEEYQINYRLIDIISKNKKFIILISIKGLLKKYYNKGELLSIKIKEELNRNFLEKKLLEKGYKKNYLVEKNYEYSIRGDILDIFPLNFLNPVRIEFFGDEIDRISFFDINTQKSIEEVQGINLYIDKNKNEYFNFWNIVNQFSKNKIDFYLENIEVLKYKIEEEILKNRELEEEYRDIFSEVEKNFIKLESKRFDFDKIKKYQDLEVIKEESKNKKFLILSEEEKRYKEIFSGFKNIEIEKNPHYEGFKYNEKIVLTDREIKGIKVKRDISPRKGLRYDNVNQIRENDYIIHENFGVGKYLGIEIIDGKDYLKVQYAGEDRLFVPIENLNRIEKYISEVGKIPELYNLGRRGFKRKREKLEEEMKIFASELIKIQARRNANLGYAFSKDTIWQEEFEEGFPYTETRDQLHAINDVKEDMESQKVMDRIICGDVGFGKTEIAMRATFKAVTDNKQVLILTPTTVLADQHYARFIERFKNYPINISVMSRIKTPKEQKEIIKKMQTGGVDIIIGTHRLLSNDIKLNNLGLIIVDEEQKFGVKAKEKLKTLKENVDLLTLTATPIPRTLNLALLGIRDISIIKTAPPNRLPVENMFINNNNEEIKKAIMKEVAREGQVFYIYNSIHSMEYKEQKLKEILPSYVKVKYIHGRMPIKQIKETIVEFENGEIDILLTTTIIENGIDIENANTIIIEGIERLGLSQIYQLRGRVGRSNKKAYCYILNDDEKKYNKKTNLRKESIEKIEGLGGGFDLSLEDMNIRGAGEILGEKQHGALETFGFNLYLKLLQEEMEKIKGEYSKKSEIKLDLIENGYIPIGYIEEYEKINIYKRAIDLKTEKEVEELYKEIEDRFGKAPEPVKILFENLKIKIIAKELGILEIKEEEKNKYNIKLDSEKIIFNKILNMITTKKCKLKNNNTIEYYKDIMEFFKEYEEEEIEGIL